MKLISRFIIYTLSNTVALELASFWLSGFSLTDSTPALLYLAALLGLLNLFLRPLIKLLLAPLIILTFGIFSFFINALLLYFLDFLSPDITIISITDLMLATLIIWAVNLLAGQSARIGYHHKKH